MGRALVLVEVRRGGDVGNWREVGGRFVTREAHLELGVIVDNY